MTVSATSRKAGPYSCNGVQTAFPFSFKVFSDSDVLVTITDVYGAESAATLITDYTVALNSDQDASPGGVVNMIVAPVNTALITLSSQVTASQSVVLTNQGGFYPKVISDAFDRMTILIQQLAEVVSRAPVVNISSGLSGAGLVQFVTNAASQVASYATQAANSAISAAASALVLANSAYSLTIKNKLLNGSLSLWQRGTSFSIPSATVVYTADRWYGSRLGGNQTVSRIAGSRGTYALKMQRTAGDTSGNWVAISQPFDTDTINEMRGNQVTLSFYAKAGANFSGVMAVAMYCGTGAVGNLFSGTWVGTNNPINATPAITTTLTKYTFVSSAIPAGTNQIDLRIGFAPSGTAGADDSMTVEQIQLEIGTTVTPFEVRPTGIELALCQRFYERLGGVASDITVRGYLLNAGYFENALFYKVTKRVAPTVAVVGTWTVSNVNQPVATGAGLNSCSIYAQSTFTGDCYFQTAGASTYVDVNAEI